MQLVARDVEVREVVVLLLDLDVARSELQVLGLEGPEHLLHVRALGFEPIDPTE